MSARCAVCGVRSSELHLSDLLNHLLLLRNDGLLSWSHHGVLTSHAAAQGTIELGAEGELSQVVCLLFGEHHALGGESLVLHAVKTSGNVSNLGVSRVVGLDRGSIAVCAVADRCAGLSVGGNVSRLLDSGCRHCGLLFVVCEGQVGGCRLWDEETRSGWCVSRQQGGWCLTRRRGWRSERMGECRVRDREKESDEVKQS